MTLRPESIAAFRQSSERLNKRETLGATDNSETWALRSSIAEYQKSFEPFLGGLSFEAYLNERHERGLSNVVVDLASDGSPLLELDHDGALAVGLSDPKTSDELTNAYKKANVDVITGSLTTQKTWNAMDTWLADHKQPFFDVALYRPMGGMVYIGAQPSEVEKDLERFDEGVALALLTRLYPRLSKQGGELFAVLDNKEVLSGIIVTFIRAWVGELNNQPGIEARLDDGTNTYGQVVFWMKKHPKAPDALPTLSE